MQFDKEKYYFTGKPCLNGHIDLRLISSRRCLSCHKEAKKVWYKTDQGKHYKSLQDAEYYEKNKETRLIKVKDYHSKHRQKYRALAAQRKKRIKQATPSWADKKAILRFYENRPEGYVVDHIIPLKGKNICGFHILSNLQYLPKLINAKKYNKYEETDI